MSGLGAGTPPDEPTVRRTTVGDWQALRAVRLQALAQDPGDFGSTHELALAVPDDEYRRRAASRTTHLAWSGGGPVGIVALVPVSGDPSRAELVSMWLDPHHRGTGLAARMVEAACALGRVDGVREASLWVMSENERARRLYERCGFTLTGRHRPVRPDEPDRPERGEEQMIRPLVAQPGDRADALTRPDGLTGTEMLVELGHLLTEDGQEPGHVDGAFVVPATPGRPTTRRWRCTSTQAASPTSWTSDVTAPGLTRRRSGPPSTCSWYISTRRWRPVTTRPAVTSCRDRAASCASLILPCPTSLQPCLR